METKKSPLSGIKIPESNKKNEGREKKKRLIKGKSNTYPTPRSYRITFNELDILRDKAEEVSEVVGSNIKITDTLILRSLIRLSGKIENKDIFEEIKNIRMEI